MKILAVDDEQAMCTFFSKAAASQGYSEVDIAQSGDEALTQAMLTRYDLITLDLNMPGATGLEILAPVRNLCPHATIAVVSAYLPDDDSPEVVGCADVMIEKPISAETFIRLLKSTAKICDARKEIRSLGRTPLTARQES